MHFAQGATQVMLAMGLATSAVVVNSETGLTVQVTVGSGIWPSGHGLAAELAANIAVARTLVSRWRIERRTDDRIGTRRIEHAPEDRPVE